MSAANPGTTVNQGKGSGRGGKGKVRGGKGASGRGSGRGIGAAPGAVGSGANAVPRQPSPRAQVEGESSRGGEMPADNDANSQAIDSADVDRLVAEKLKVAEAQIEARLRKELTETLTKQWTSKVDAEVERTKNMEERASRVEKQLEEREAQILAEKRRAESLTAEIDQLKAQAAARDQTVEEMREAARGDALRIESLEAQLATQQGRAEALEQSYAAELDASAKAASESRQQISGLNAELEARRREVAEEKQRSEAIAADASRKERVLKQGGASSSLFGFLSSRLRLSTASSFGRWKLFVVHSHQTSRRSDLEHAHTISLAKVTKDSEAKIARLKATATVQRLELEQQIRDLHVAAEQMQLALVQVAKPGAGSPLFDRGVALKRCNFG